jgi:hypothetical protein
LAPHEKDLWKILATDGERQIGQQTQQGDANDDPNPKAALAGAEPLGIDAEHAAKDESDPDHEERQEDLAVEFGRLKAESIQKFTHGGR